VGSLDGFVVDGLKDGLAEGIKVGILLVTGLSVVGFAEGANEIDGCCDTEGVTVGFNVVGAIETEGAVVGVFVGERLGA
jgi:hypothetical protein